MNGVSAVVSNNVYTASNVMLYNEGANTITVAATDPAGNSSSTSITVYRDTTSPILSITSPINGSTVNTSTINVTGIIDDKSAVVTVNGNPARVDYDDRLGSNIFSALINLSEGDNTILVVAADQAGNSTRASLIVKYASNTQILTIQYPTDGAVFSSQRFVIRGSIGDPTVTVTMSDGACYVFGTSFYCKPYKLLSEGANTFTVTATTATGLSTTASVTVKYTPPPMMTITSPAQNSKVNVPFSITGTIDDSSDTITAFQWDGNDWVETGQTTISGNNFVISNVELTSSLQFYHLPGEIGWSYLFIRAKNGYGVETWSSLSLYVNSLAKVYYPLEGDTVNTNTISVIGAVNDNRISVTVNGITATVENKVFTATGVVLTDGANAITVTATDAAGTSSTIPVNVMCAPNNQSGPILSDIQPGDGYISVNPNGSIYAEVDDPAAIVRVNGYQMPVTSTDRLGVNHNYISCGFGEYTIGANTVVITATNASGATTIQNVLHYYSPKPPDIIKISPSDGGTSNTNPTIVTVNISLTSYNLANVTINGIAATLNQYEWSKNIATASIPMNDGPNTITVTATDIAGYSSSSTITVNYENRESVFTATAPAANSHINNAAVGYTLSKAIAKGSIAIRWTGGVQDNAGWTGGGGGASFYLYEYLYDLIPSEMTAGTHTINTGINLVDGAVYTISFDATGTDGFVYSTVSNTNITYDTTASIATINSPAANSITNNSRVNYTLSKDVSSGNITYTWTGGTEDSSSQHTYVLTSTDMANGAHAIGTGLNLIDGAVYTVGLENVVAPSGIASNSASNINVGFSSTAIAITDTTPTASVNTINSSIVSYTLSGPASAGKITYTWTGGYWDGNSPQVYTMTGNDLAAGPHMVNTNLFLIDGAIYTVSFEATDIAGNPATTVSNAQVTAQIPFELIITSPINGSYISDTWITISGMVSKQSHINVNGTDHYYTSGAFTIVNYWNSLNLVEGENTITITATDDDGNTASATITVIYDTVPPVVTITSPVYGSYINSNSFNITGTVNKNIKAVTLMSWDNVNGWVEKEVTTFTINAFEVKDVQVNGSYGDYLIRVTDLYVTS